MDFIGSYSNVFGHDECSAIISAFDAAEAQGFAHSRNQAKNIAEDSSLFSLELEHIGGAFSVVMDRLWECYREYAKEYAVAFEKTAEHKVYSLKIQKTTKCQGYHSWHYEADARESSQRLLAFTIYLNDVEDGGETEFLYQSKRVNAEAGKVVIFPAGFTHTHRGNPPMSGNKYIITGWFEF